ncbi:uncharacterized protein LOC143247411 [Tachypleus tridentatus]|uniref:uncharacterized protein LOC143247411 n=1 Tax=Tachypleus tridentatus TaxID=6853 RepID=UPI003FCF3CF3
MILRCWVVLALVGVACGVSRGSNNTQFIENKERHQPYEFGYRINDGNGNSQERQETGKEDGSKIGAYGYRDALGIYRQVEYLADRGGFRANIKTNEPGTAHQDPANVIITGEDPSGIFKDRFDPVSTSIYPAKEFLLQSENTIFKYPKELLPFQPKPIRTKLPNSEPNAVLFPKAQISTLSKAKPTSSPLLITKSVKIVRGPIVVPERARAHIFTVKQEPVFLPQPQYGARLDNIQQEEPQRPKGIQHPHPTKVTDHRIKSEKVQDQANDEIPVYKDK